VDVGPRLVFALGAATVTGNKRLSATSSVSFGCPGGRPCVASALTAILFVASHVPGGPSPRDVQSTDPRRPRHLRNRPRSGIVAQRSRSIGPASVPMRRTTSAP